MNIQDIINEYKGKLDYLDIEILIANSLGKTREFILTYPSQAITKIQETKIKKNISRRMSGEPVAYILGHKEFYGLDFIVNKNTLVPRPETEMIVDEVLNLLRSMLRSKQRNIVVADIGTGSGCIMISITHTLCHSDSPAGGEESLNIKDGDIDHGILTSHSSAPQDDNIKFYATDISEGALNIAKKNAKKHSLDKKIKFLHGNLLDPIIQNSKPASTADRLKIFAPSLSRRGENSTMIIVANLPYLSKEIYNSAPIDVRKFEPKSALYSPEQGLQHYRKLLLQIKKLLTSCFMLHVTCFFEISPEQKVLLAKIIKSILPTAKIEFKKDLASKWRVCKVSI